MRRSHHLLVLCLLIAAAAAAASASQLASKPRAPAVSPAAAADFVRRSCRSLAGTGYPRDCERSLMPRAPAVGRSPRRLAQAALAVAADRARACSAYIGVSPKGKGSKGGGAMGDCAETVRDAAGLLRQSAAEVGAGRMGRASSPRFAWRLSNAQTWASAALTDADTCLDSLAASGAGGAPRDDVRRRVVAVAQATSNALALVNRLQPAAPHPPPAVAT
ncbi:21 kDa protein [Brachypodium distachyon]|uniref:21 kDa protein n=1 Tax=Brachypodium distachyon TaxID=15368 RepID=UPI0001D43E80|nr:21 kDa protein [Brachypodium distachyon]|eukprot:XP_003580990.1 21 kDa protein [Brachypodium distachyon]